MQFFTRAPTPPKCPQKEEGGVLQTLEKFKPTRGTRFQIKQMLTVSLVFFVMAISFVCLGIGMTVVSEGDEKVVFCCSLFIWMFLVIASSVSIAISDKISLVDASKIAEVNACLDKYHHLDIPSYLQRTSTIMYLIQVL